MDIHEINRLWRRLAPRVERASERALRQAERALTENGRAVRDAAALLALLPLALYAQWRGRGLR